MSKILVIDDAKKNLKLISALLKNLIFDSEVITAQTGSEGIEKAVTELPDIIILDAVMPEMDGFEVCERLKHEEKTKHIPVIMVTAVNAEQENRIRGIEAGADIFLSSPIDRAELAAQINIALRIKQAEDQLRKNKVLLEKLADERTEQLRESEEKYRSVFENTGTATMIIEDDSKISMVNAEVEQLSGYSKKEIEGEKSWTEFVVREDLERIRKDYVQSKEGGKSLAQEDYFCFIDKQGNVKHVLLKIATIPGTEKTIASLRDITLRKEAEEWLIHERYMVDRIMKTSPAGIMVVNSAGHIVFVNNRSEEVLGLSKEEITQLSHDSPKIRFTDTGGEPVPDEQLPFMRVMNAGKTVYGMHYAFHRPDGQRVFLSISGASFPEESGKIGGAVLTLGDITEYKRMMKELKIRNDAISSSINAFAFTDLDGNLTYVNPSFREMWGYDSEKEVLGKSYFKFWHKEVNIRKIVNSLRCYESWTGELVAMRKDGSLFDVHLSANMVKDEYGNPICIMGSFVDVSEKIKMQKALVQSEKLSSLGQLSAGLSHELRNPLAVISLCAQFCLDTMKLSRKLEENFQMIYRSSQRASKLIDDLLDFARPSEMIRSPVDVNEMVTRVWQKAKLEAHSSQVVLDSRLGEKLPEIIGDPEKLGQVFLNLFTNAIQATSNNGKITVRTRILDSKDLIEVEIIDNGPGVPEEYREKIFDPFFTTKDNGTGLGLSISHTIVKQHRGSITVDCEGNSGTKVSVRLPAD